MFSIAYKIQEYGEVVFCDNSDNIVVLILTQLEHYLKGEYFNPPIKPIKQFHIGWSKTNTIDIVFQFNTDLIESPVKLIPAIKQQLELYHKTPVSDVQPYTYPGTDKVSPSAFTFSFPIRVNTSNCSD